MSKSVLISAGEASGDLHAAKLVKALVKIKPQINVTAMGGEKLRDAGAKIIVDCSEIAVIGIFEVLANYKKIKSALDKMREQIRNNPPDLLILVDYQEFNLKLAKTAKENAVKVLFYISPQVWAWRPHRVYKIGRFIDMMAVLFPFEEKFYKDAKVPVTFVGHPLLDEVKPGKSKEQVLNEYDLSPDQQIIGLFPGSRLGEIKRILPLQLESAEILQAGKKKLQFILPAASTLTKADFTPWLDQYKKLGVKTVQGRVYDVAQVCDAIITASGTATLEIALMGTPNVIVYKVSLFTYWIAKYMVTIDKIGLANIAAEKNIVKEFIQSEAKPDLIAEEMQRILDDKDYREKMVRELKQVKDKLGQKGGADNIAQLAYDMLYNRVLPS